MAVADPLPPTAIPLGKQRATNCQTKQKEQLDIALLCSKLEAHKRTQDKLRQMQHKKDATKKSTFVPRYAAKQFAVTATPMKDDLVWTAPRWTSQAEPGKSRTSEDNSHLNPKQTYAALLMGMTHHEAVAAATITVHKHSLPHPAQASSRRGSGQNVGKQVVRQKSGRGSADIQRDPVSCEESDEVDAVGYRPGDSSKRRMLQEKQREAHGIAAIGHSDPILSTTNIPAFRQGRDEPNEMPYDMPMPGDEDESLNTTTRPKLNAHDRPNWAQQSQCGDDMRRTLGLPLLSRKHRGNRTDEARRSSTDAVAHKREQLHSVDSRRPSDSLISDAVKLLKKDEKRHRRESLKSFFKRS